MSVSIYECVCLGVPTEKALTSITKVNHGGRDDDEPGSNRTLHVVQNSDCDLVAGLYNVPQMTNNISLLIKIK